MNDEIKQKAGLIYNVVEAVILGMAVMLNVWNANMVITHGKSIAQQETKSDSMDVRVNRVESSGSPAFLAHEKEDNQRVNDIRNRVEKLETAVLALQATPGELKAIGVSLETLHESQKRIEERLDKQK